MILIDDRWYSTKNIDWAEFMPVQLTIDSDWRRIHERLNFDGVRNTNSNIHLIWIVLKSTRFLSLENQCQPRLSFSQHWFTRGDNFPSYSLMQSIFIQYFFMVSYSADPKRAWFLWLFLQNGSRHIKIIDFLYQNDHRHSPSKFEKKITINTISLGSSLWLGKKKSNLDEGAYENDRRG